MIMSSRVTSSRTRSSARTRRSTTTSGSLRRTGVSRTSRGSTAKSCSSLSSVGSSGTSPRLRPLERRVRNRISVRVVGRESERAVDPRLQLFGEDVLEPVGLVVDVLDVEPERLGEVELEQPVVTDHLDGDPLPGRCQANALVARVVDELEGRELLDHLAGRACGDSLLAREGRDRNARFALLELVDRLQVVLDRVGER